MGSKPENHKVKLVTRRRQKSDANKKKWGKNLRVCDRWIYYNDAKNALRIKGQQIDGHAFRQFLKDALIIKRNTDGCQTEFEEYDGDHTKENDDAYIEWFFGTPDKNRRLAVSTDPETRQRRRRLVYCPNNDGGDGLCTQADLDEFGPDSPGLKALLRRKRRLVYRPIHRL